MEVKKLCETCNNKHYIFTFDTKSNEDEIQKCDDCNVFKTDEESRAWLGENNTFMNREEK